MNSPKISIIVPIYNTEKYLSQCIDSILAQTFTDFELLLVDDGSTDASSAICDKYVNMDSRVRAFHKENGGVSSARNIGLDNAIGEWIAFVDSDDWVEKNWLENYDLSSDADVQIQGVKQVGRDNVVLRQIEPLYAIYTQAEWFALLHKYKKLDSPEIHLRFNWPVAKLYNRFIIDKFHLRFPLAINLGEDVMFNLNYYLHCKKIALLPDFSYNYMIDHCTLTRRTYPANKMMEWNEYYFPTIARIKEIDTNASDSLLCWRITAVLRAAFRNVESDFESKKEALKHYKNHRTSGSDALLGFPYNMVSLSRWLPLLLQANLLSGIFFMLRPFKRANAKYKSDKKR